MIDLERHPVLVIDALQDRYDGEIEFEFSKYIHTPQQLLDKRQTFRITGVAVTESWANEVVESLQNDEELALHSRVKRRGRTFHIPMIDFVSTEWTDDVEQELRKYLPKKILGEIFIFSSGRSFHAYSLHLLEPKEWIEFMGRLLLINPPENVQIVDSRWVGHRLIGGYSSLRWSCNTDSYRKYPEVVGQFERLRVLSGKSSQLGSCGQELKN